VLEQTAPPAFDPAQAPDLRVSAISPASASLLERLGAWPRILAMRAAPYRRMQVWEDQEQNGTLFDAAEAGVDALGHIVENRIVQLATTACLQEKDDIRYICPARIASIVYSPKASRVTLEDGTVLVARLLVAADGARSKCAMQPASALPAGTTPCMRWWPAAKWNTASRTSPGNALPPPARKPSCRSPARMPLWCGTTRPPRSSACWRWSDEELVSAFSATFPQKLGGIRQLLARAPSPSPVAMRQRMPRMAWCWPVTPPTPFTRWPGKGSIWAFRM
jgi:2-octaprenyl-3-methyl-6-methoxy-1,4-benzoquinol hydroxylase